MYFFLFAFFLASFSSALGQMHMVFSAHADDHNKIIDRDIDQPFQLTKLSCDADVYLSEGEFRYLTELKEGREITQADLKRAVSYLFKKNKFETIKLSLDDHNDGKHLHCALTSFWTFKRLKIHGIMIGKDNYLQHYLLESGDPFDHAKHQHSIEKILEALKAEGYFDARIESFFKKDHKNKQIKVDIKINRGAQFKIKALSLVVKKDDHLKNIAIDDLQAEIHQEFCDRMLNYSYSKALLTRETTALKKMLEQRGFLDVDIQLQEKIDRENKAISLAFAIDLNHKKEFTFIGNQFYSSQELLDQVLMFGRSAWMLPSSLLCQELEHAYHTKGFWSAQIIAQEKDDQFIFSIKEGPRACVNSVILKYAHSFDNQLLIKNVFSTFLKASYYDADLLNESLEALSAWYLKNGYLDMKVIKHEYSKIDPTHFTLIITVDEGQRSYLTSIAIEPFPELAQEGPFLEFLQKKQSIPFDSQELAKQRKWLINHFLNQGYAHVDAKPEIQRESNNVAITWKVSISEHKVRFGKTVVVGSTRFPFEYVLREMSYKQGDVWNKKAIKQSFLNLKNLDVFEHIHLHPDQSDPLSEEKPIIVKVQEDDPFEVRLRGGLELKNFVQRYTFEGFTYRAGGTFIVRSPLDVGDQLRLDAEFARVHREVVLKYERPWLFDTPLKSITTAYANAYDQPGFIGSPINIYTLYQSGALFGLSRDYGPFEFGVTAGFEWMKTVIPDCSDRITMLIGNISRAIDFNPLLLNQSVPFFQIEPTIILDRLDERLNPTRGTFSLLSFKGMFPMRCASINTNFVKATFEQSFFMSIKSIVAALRFRAGHIFGRKFSAIMPNERFYLGGANSLRGYETDSAGPLGTFFDCDGTLQYAPKGGRTMMNVNAELRIPVINNIGAVVFQDVGALSNCGFADFGPQALLASTGFGVRFNTPLGPLRFDIGWKWDSQASWDRNFAWFLAFGHAF